MLVRTPGRVAEDGYHGFIRGRRLVVPGFANQVAAFLPRIVSRERMMTIARTE
jgi:hypothetical protein